MYVFSTIIIITTILKLLDFEIVIYFITKVN